jgi:hypothetical protein
MAEDYLVQLTMKLRGDTPNDAAVAFVDRLVERGLRDWVYTVLDPITEERIGYFDGGGTVINIDGLPGEADMTPEALFAQAQQEQREQGKDEDWFGQRYRELLREYHFLPDDEQQPDEQQAPEESDAELLAVAEQANGS